MALTDLATTGAGEQLVVRLEAAGLPWNEGGSWCQVEAGGLVDHHKEEQEQNPHLKLEAGNLSFFGVGQNIQYLLINGNLSSI